MYEKYENNEIVHIENSTGFMYYHMTLKQFHYHILLAFHTSPNDKKKLLEKSGLKPNRENKKLFKYFEN